MLKRILVTRVDRIGDVVLSTPVFSALRERYPGTYIAAMVAKSNRELVEGNPCLDEVILYDKRGEHQTLASNLQFCSALRAKRFDVVINLHATNRVHWLAFLAGIPRRIGYRKKSGFLLTDSIRDEKWKGERHETEYNFDLLSLVDVPKPKEYKLYIPLAESLRNELDRLLGEERMDRTKPYVVIHPSSSCPSRVWPSERYAQVADILAERWQANVVLISGRGSDVLLANRVESLMRTRAVNLAGKLSLGMLAWLLKDSRILISNDSGPVHVASAFGTRVIAIFGRNQSGLSPRRWRPLGPNSSYIHKDVGCIECAAHRCNLGFLCLDEVMVEDVVKVAERPILEEALKV